MQVVFLGTSEFAVPSLRSLVKSSNHRVKFVITQPDSPQGRGLKVLPPPVKIEALQWAIPVIQPVKISSSSICKIVVESGAEIIFCASYGEFLTESLIQSLPFGAVNLHPSKLPLYRGAAPVQRALMDGCKETAVTFIQMSRDMDAGDILLQKDLKILPEETAGELLERTAKIGGDLLPGLLDDIENGRIVPVKQDHTKVTFAPAVKKIEGLIDWSNPARQIFDMWRGFTPKPGIFSFLKSKRFIFTKIKPAIEDAAGKDVPGTICIYRGKLLVTVGDKKHIEVMGIKPEGRGSIDAEQFINGYKPEGLKFSDCL